MRSNRFPFTKRATADEVPWSREGELRPPVTSLGI